MCVSFLGDSPWFECINLPSKIESVSKEYTAKRTTCKLNVAQTGAKGIVTDRTVNDFGCPIREDILSGVNSPSSGSLHGPSSLAVANFRAGRVSEPIPL